MKLLPLIFPVLAVACCPSLAGQNERFAEFPQGPAKTRIYDLQSVQTTQSGRFTIISTSIDEPDVMRFELRALDTLRTYCKRPDGSYPPPVDLFALGPADLPTKNIEVKSSKTESAGRTREYKSASWHYPYTRLALEDHGEFLQEEVSFFCKDGLRTDEGELYLEKRKSITNGIRNKELFDCKRGLWGDFVLIPGNGLEPDEFWPSDPTKVHMNVVTPRSFGDLYYRSICLQVMHEKPFSPE